MSADINLKGTVLKPDTGVQDFVKWVGYALIVVGLTWGLAIPVLFTGNSSTVCLRAGQRWRAHLRRIGRLISRPV